MKLFQSLFMLFFFLTATICIAQENQNFDCKILKNIKLKYVDNPDQTAYFTIQNNKHVEHLQNEKYYIKSDLEWISECEYNAKMTEITLPEFPFKPGDIMNVKFNHKENSFILGTATVNGNSFPIKFEIIK